MLDTTSFVSTCPMCKQPRRQNGYKRIELVESLNADLPIDAYCLSCDVLWPISGRERSEVATLTQLYETVW
jgi:hypothetical protein